MEGKPPALDPVTDRAVAWAALIASGEASAADRRALADWRRADAVHDEAYRRVEAVSVVMRDVGRDYRARQEGASGEVVSLAARRRVDRRAVLTGAIAASAAGILMVGHRLDMLPGVGGARPDFATSTGERRTVRLAQGLSLDLDARSSISVAKRAEGYRVALLDGRAEVTARLGAAGSVAVAVGRGQAVARTARFDVELDGGQACVTCLDGALRVQHPAGQVELGAAQRVDYTDAAIQPVLPVSVAEADSWKNGWLIFRGVPLRQVVGQLNRYRQGRIVLANAALASRPVTGTFQVGRIDTAVGQIVQLTGARGTALPGGVLVLT